MTFTSTVDTVISSINADIATLQGLLEQTESETLQSVNLDIFPAPLFDDTTQTWTLSQNTANASGVYEGIYSLAAADGCAILEIVSVDAHSNPASGAPAALIACGASNYTDQVSVNALHSKNLKKLKIRSGSPFQIKVKVAAVWCCMFDFTTSSNGFAPWVSGSGSYAPGAGWNSANYTYNGTRYTSVSIGKTLPEITVVEVEMEYSINPGNQNYAGILPRNNGNYGSSGETSNASSASVITWTGSQVIDEMRLDVSVNAGGWAGSSRITKLVLRGLGTNPFNNNAC